MTFLSSTLDAEDRLPSHQQLRVCPGCGTVYDFVSSAMCPECCRKKKGKNEELNDLFASIVQHITQSYRMRSPIVVDDKETIFPKFFFRSSVVFKK